MIEKQRHVDAFNYFFNLISKGIDVSEAIITTAEYAGVKERTMWRWHKELDWKTKRIKRSAEIQREVEKKQIETLAQNKANYLKMCHKALDRVIQDDFKALDISSIKEFDKTVRLALLLQDSPTEVTKNENNVNVKVNPYEFDEDLIDKILDEETKAEEELKKELLNNANKPNHALDDASDEDMSNIDF